MESATTLLRYCYPDGRLQAAFPLLLLESTEDRLVGWQPLGSEIAYWATSSGEDPRATPLESRFHQILTTGRRTWTGSSVLRVIPLDEPWQVVHFWDASGTFTGWYVNLESTKQKHRLGVTAVDWHLDLLISPTFEVAWKDEDEAKAAVRTQYLREQDLLRARRTAEQIAGDPRGFVDSLGHWDTFRPHTNMHEPLVLPNGWDALNP
ncbi:MULTISPECIES: DUF402 domain-containing protein [unclassified Curtobacterium]|uniref:DUF402 domain-containing protein n=1 Tax=unclassified Curtobacterium TaxID=257496 RepID=UPI00104DC6D1|nr:DUF402 domain-containing protein [Curtobacterium sp. PhB146]